MKKIKTKEPSAPLPNVVLALTWVLLLVAAINTISDFIVGFSGFKLIVSMVVGAFVCGVFVYFATKERKHILPSNNKTLYILGAIASFVILLLPGIFIFVYSKIIEPRIIENELDSYFSMQNSPHFPINTIRSNVVLNLIKADRASNEQNFTLSNTLLIDADKSMADEDLMLKSFSCSIHAKIEYQKGSFITAGSFISDGLDITRKQNGNYYWTRIKIKLLSAKAITYSLQYQGIEFKNFLPIYDSIIEEANKLNDSELIARVTMNKVSALEAIALALHSIEEWNNWKEQAKPAVELFHRIHSPNELGALSNYLGGFSEEYTEIPNDSLALKNQVLKEYDTIFEMGENLIATKSNSKVTIKDWTCNSILFNCFTRDFPVKKEYGRALDKLNKIEPSDGNDDYLYIAQWHQIKGLLLSKLREGPEAEKELLLALNAYSDVKEIEKESEVIIDLLNYVYNGRDNKNTIELYLRWAGLRLSEKNFEPELKDRPRLVIAIDTLVEHKIATPNLINRAEILP